MTIFTISDVQYPPGSGLVLPTPANPCPAQNPQIFNDAMHVRQRVFIEEQHVAPEAEIDSDDARSWQWVLYANRLDTSVSDGTQPSKPVPVAVIRLVPPPLPPHKILTHPEKAKGLPEYDLEQEPCVKLTRVAVVPEYRGRGLAKRLVETALTWAVANAAEIDSSYMSMAGKEPLRFWRGLVLVHAQVGVEKMYERLGFQTDNALGHWDEEGIEHIGMWRRLNMNRKVYAGL